MKSGSLNFLEPSGPLQACNGTDLPLPYKELVDTDRCVVTTATLCEVYFYGNTSVN